MQFDLKLGVLSLLTGVILGAIFGLFLLPIPAPAIIEGALGVVGTTIGGVFVAPWLREIVARVLENLK